MLPGPQMALCVKFFRCGASLPKATLLDGRPSTVQYRAGVSPQRGVTARFPVKPGMTEDVMAGSDRPSLNRVGASFIHF